MPEPLKNMFNLALIEKVGHTLSLIIKDFNTKQFANEIFNEEWESLELKARMHHISMAMAKQLPRDYEKAIDIALSLTDKAQGESKEMSFVYMFLPNYVEKFGIDDLQTSIKAIERITQFTSCEFAVRPFIIKYPKEMMAQMLEWSTHTHPNVRRFSSEGCRPRLPWAMALPQLKKDPTPILPILENLKNDGSEFVRKSVANNLNDISKDHPEILLDVAKKWKGKSKDTDWIIKHACRTLLKQGNPTAMELFGFGTSKDIKIEHFKVKTPKVVFGDYLEFSFDLKNLANKDTNIRLEYAIYYQKANGTLAKKVYKISEKVYAQNSSTTINRRQAFKPISTRKFYAGLHQVALIVNGVEQKKVDFELVGSP